MVRHHLLTDSASEQEGEDQRYRASGLNLVLVSIVLWNIVYLAKAVEYLTQQGMDIPEEHLQQLSPLGWEHINLTGDYIWNLKSTNIFEQFRPLRVDKAESFTL